MVQLALVEEAANELHVVAVIFFVGDGGTVLDDPDMSFHEILQIDVVVHFDSDVRIVLDVVEAFFFGIRIQTYSDCTEHGVVVCDFDSLDSL